jgi:antitoxin VapB
MIYINSIYQTRCKLNKAKLFMNGRSQAVRLPKEFRFDGDEVYIQKVGDAVILIPYHAPWKTLVDSLQLFSADFMEDRAQPAIQDREDAFP